MLAGAHFPHLYCGIYQSFSILDLGIGFYTTKIYPCESFTSLGYHTTLKNLVSTVGIVLLHWYHYSKHLKSCTVLSTIVSFSFREPARPNFELETPADFGNVVLAAKTIQKEIMLRNKGAKTGNFLQPTISTFVQGCGCSLNLWQSTIFLHWCNCWARLIFITFIFPSWL